MRKLFIFLCVLFGLATQAFAVDFPQYENFVTDTSGIISADAEASLNSKLKTYEAQTGTEIAVVTIPLIPDGLSPNEYATQLGNTWGVGKAKVDNGVILLIETADSPGNRDIYIATGSQLEGGLTDIESRDIVDNIIIPRFKESDFDGGVTAGVDAIILGLNGESFTSLRSGSSESENIEGIGNIIFVVFFFVFPWLAAILGRSKRIWPGGAIGVIGGGIFGAILSIAVWGVVAIAIGMGLFGLLFDWIVSRNYGKAKARGISPAWWAGGRGGFGGGSGGGFGGFGGGGFSGGGGGGSW
ncbi:MAG: TPM domain-containing protein [Candidatus Gracilibacteria bacterium]|nr:TPM domain-containing protein [Candidatus Gracilibacteria bacterium]